MRKILYGLLCFIMVFTMTACAGNGNIETTESTEPITLPQVGDESIKRFEDMYDAESEIHKQIENLQGKFEAIFPGTTDISFITDDAWHRINESGDAIEKITDMPAETAFVQRFDNAIDGENLIIYEGTNTGRIMQVKNTGEIKFSDVEFNIMMDTILNDNANSMYVLHPTETGYEAKHYVRNENQETVMAHEETIQTIMLPNGDTFQESGDLLCILTDTKCFSVYLITEKNDVYAIETINGNAMVTSTNEPIVKNAERIMSEFAIPYVTSPVFAQVDDIANLYITVSGEDLLDTNDDTVVKIKMPDGHTTEDITGAIDCGRRIIFIFSDNTVHMTDIIESNRVDDYELTKLDVISEMAANQQILQLATTKDQYGASIYMLTADGEILVYTIE